MLCDKCKQREANIHIKQSVNGVTTEKNLCEVCAREEQGLMNAFSGGGFFDDLFETSLLKRGSGRLGSLFDPEIGQEQMIPGNDRYNAEFVGVGQPFSDGIELPEIKIVPHKQEEKKKTDTKDDLKQQLKEAVKNEDYEQAARLRDLLKEEKKEKEDGEKTAS